jgi:hypothetical protein
MYENLTKKLKRLLSLAKAAKVAVSPVELTGSKEDLEILKNLSANLQDHHQKGKALYDAHAVAKQMGDQSLINEVLSHIGEHETKKKQMLEEIDNHKLKMRKAQQSKASQLINVDELGQATKLSRPDKTAAPKIVSPFIGKESEGGMWSHINKVSTMPVEEGKKHALKLVHSSLLDSAHKGEIVYKIMKTSTPTDLARFMAYHIQNPKRTMGKD